MSQEIKVGSIFYDLKENKLIVVQGIGFFYECLFLNGDKKDNIAYKNDSSFFDGKIKLTSDSLKDTLKLSEKVIYDFENQYEPYDKSDYDGFETQFIVCKYEYQGMSSSSKTSVLKIEQNDFIENVFGRYEFFIEGNLVSPEYALSRYVTLDGKPFGKKKEK